MSQQHPYCRTCGSMVRSLKVCHYCGCDPAKGHNYCCDCGTSTIPEAIMCIHCGASFQKRFPVALAIMVSLAVAITVIIAGYSIFASADNAADKTSDDLNIEKKDSGNVLQMQQGKDEPLKIVNNLSTKLFTNRNNAISRLAKNLPSLPKPETKTDIEPVLSKNKPIQFKTEPAADIPSRVSMNIFSSREMRNYAAGCTYFEGRSKNNIVFFTTNVYGYIKINGKVYALQGVQKGNDIARFTGAGYEVTIEILGLAGNESNWLAEATLVVKDERRKTLSSHKVYSSCTDF